MCLRLCLPPKLHISVRLGVQLVATFTLFPRHNYFLFVRQPKKRSRWTLFLYGEVCGINTRSINCWLVTATIQHTVGWSTPFKMAQKMIRVIMNSRSILLGYSSNLYYLVAIYFYNDNQVFRRMCMPLYSFGQVYHYNYYYRFRYECLCRLMHVHMM